MGRQLVGLEHLQVWMGLINALSFIILSALTILNKLPASIRNVAAGHGLAWWGSLVALLLTGIWCLRQGFAPKSRLLLPDRFLIRAGERRHLIGREDEVRELADLCERQALVFLEGESGSGKSALVRAGLVDECRRRHLLQPIYLDLSGADWEDRLPSLLATELWCSFAGDDRSPPGIKRPCPSGEIFSLLSSAVSAPGRKPLLIFDQFDDYQSAHRRHFREGRQESTWIKSDQLIQRNGFWRELDRLLKAGDVHALFITRTDNAAGLDTVRFLEARTFHLRWVSRNLISPLLDEISTPEAEDRPVVHCPESGWEQLKRRLLRDLTENDSILPVRLSVVLQALRRLPCLTAGEYQRYGGAEGLERLHIERNIMEAARAAGLLDRQVRTVLVALVDPVKGKTVQLSSSEILKRLELDPAPHDDRFCRQIQTALEHLEGRDVVRRRPAETGDEEIWLLHHDYLCRGVTAAERHANRWHAFLKERARQFRLSMGAVRNWRALLSPAEQARLALQRLRGRFRYAEHRRFALVSTLRFLPYLILLAAGLQAYQLSQDLHQAGIIFAALREAPEKAEQKESAQIRRMAASSERVQWRVLELAFASETSARKAQKCLPFLVHTYLGLDPSGERRGRFWRKIAQPALKRDDGPAMALLAAPAFEEALGDDAETQAKASEVAQVLLETAKAQPDGRMDRDLPKRLASLAPHFHDKSARTLCDNIIDVMKRKRSWHCNVMIAEALDPFAKELNENQAGEVVRQLVRAEFRPGDYPHSYLSGTVENLIRTFAPRLSSIDARLISEEVVETLVSSTDGDRLEVQWRTLANLVKRLEKGETRLLADRLVQASLSQSDPIQLAWMMRGLGLMVDQADGELRSRAVGRLIQALEQEEDASRIDLLLDALYDNREALDEAQGRRAARWVFERMAREKRLSTIADLVARLEGLAPWLDAAEAWRAWERILEAVEYGETRSSFPFPLIEVTRRLNDAQRVTLAENLIALGGRLDEHLISGDAERAVRFHFKEVAALLTRNQARAMAENIVASIEQERRPWMVHHSCDMAVALGMAEDARLTGRVGDRILWLMENESSYQELQGLIFAMKTIRTAVGDDILRRVSGRLTEVLVNKSKDPFRLEVKAWVLAEYADYMPPADVQKTVEMYFSNHLKGSGPPSLGLYGLLQPVWRKIPEKTFMALAEPLARCLEQSASEAAHNYLLGIHSDSEEAHVEAVAELLSHAQAQTLLNILRAPFALDPLRRVVLRAWELKTGKRFNNNLARFVTRAQTGQETKTLDFRSPPRLDDPRPETPPKAAAAGGR